MPIMQMPMSTEDLLYPFALDGYTCTLDGYKVQMMPEGLLYPLPFA